MDNLKKWKNSEIYNPQRLKQEEKMNRSIVLNNIESAIKTKNKNKKIKTNKSPGPDSFTSLFYQKN